MGKKKTVEVQLDPRQFIAGAKAIQRASKGFERVLSTSIDNTIRKFNTLDKNLSKTISRLQKISGALNPRRSRPAGKQDMERNLQRQLSLARSLSAELRGQQEFTRSLGRRAGRGRGMLEIPGDALTNAKAGRRISRNRLRGEARATVRAIAEEEKRATRALREIREQATRTGAFFEREALKRSASAFSPLSLQAQKRIASIRGKQGSRSISRRTADELALTAASNDNVASEILFRQQNRRKRLVADLIKTRGAGSLQGLTGGDLTHIAEAARRQGVSKKQITSLIEERKEINKTIAAFKRLGAAQKGVAKLGPIGEQLKRILITMRTVVISILAFKTFSFFGSLIKGAIDFQSVLEQARLGISQVISTTTRFAGILTKKVLPIPQQLTLGFGLADEALSKLKEDSVALGLPLEELVNTFTTVAGTARRAGVSFRGSLDLMESIVTLSQRAGIPFTQVVRSIDNIFTGLRVQQTQLGIILNLNEQIIKQKIRENKLEEFLQERLKGVASTLKLNLTTYKGIKQAIKSSFDVFISQISNQAFKFLKDELNKFREFINSLQRNRDKIILWRIQTAEIAKNLGNAAGFAVTLFNNTTKIARVLGAAGLGALLSRILGLTPSTAAVVLGGAQLLPNNQVGPSSAFGGVLDTSLIATGLLGVKLAGGFSAIRKLVGLEGLLAGGATRAGVGFALGGAAEGAVATGAAGIGTAIAARLGAFSLVVEGAIPQIGLAVAAAAALGFVIKKLIDATKRNSDILAQNTRVESIKAKERKFAQGGLASGNRFLSQLTDFEIGGTRFAPKLGRAIAGNLQTRAVELAGKELPSAIKSAKDIGDIRLVNALTVVLEEINRRTVATVNTLIDVDQAEKDIKKELDITLRDNSNINNLLKSKNDLLTSGNKILLNEQSFIAQQAQINQSILSEMQRKLGLQKQGNDVSFSAFQTATFGSTISAANASIALKNARLSSLGIARSQPGLAPGRVSEIGKSEKRLRISILEDRLKIQKEEIAKDEQNKRRAFDQADELLRKQSEQNKLIEDRNKIARQLLALERKKLIIESRVAAAKVRNAGLDVSINKKAIDAVNKEFAIKIGRQTIGGTGKNRISTPAQLRAIAELTRRRDIILAPFRSKLNRAQGRQNEAIAAQEILGLQQTVSLPARSLLLSNKQSNDQIALRNRSNAMRATGQSIENRLTGERAGAVVIQQQILDENKKQSGALEAIRQSVTSVATQLATFVTFVAFSDDPLKALKGFGGQVGRNSFQSLVKKGSESLISKIFGPKDKQGGKGSTIDLVSGLLNQSSSSSSKSNKTFSLLSGILDKSGSSNGRSNNGLTLLNGIFSKSGSAGSSKSTGKFSILSSSSNASGGAGKAGKASAIIGGVQAVIGGTAGAFANAKQARNDPRTGRTTAGVQRAAATGFLEGIGVPGAKPLGKLGVAGAVIGGAATGAVIGAHVGGPIGAIVGAVIGGIVGAVVVAVQKKKSTGTLQAIVLKEFFKRAGIPRVGKFGGQSLRGIPIGAIGSKIGPNPALLPVKGQFGKNLRGEALAAGTLLQQGFGFSTPGRKNFNQSTANSLINTGMILGLSEEDTLALIRKFGKSSSGSLSSAVLEVAKNRQRNRKRGTPGREASFLGAVTGAVVTFGDFPRSVDAARIALNVFATDGRIQIQKLAETMSQVSSFFRKAIPDAITEGIQKGDFFSAGRILGEKLSSAFRDRLIEGVIEKGAFGKSFTDVMVSVIEVADLIASGDLRGARVKALKIGGKFATANAQLGQVISTIRPIALGVEGTLGTFGSTNGLINQGAGFFDTPSFARVGTPIGQPMPAIVHGQETIRSPEGEDALMNAISSLSNNISNVGNITIKVLVDGKEISSTIQEGVRNRRSGLVMPDPSIGV